MTNNNTYLSTHFLSECGDYVKQPASICFVYFN